MESGAQGRHAQAARKGAVYATSLHLPYALPASHVLMCHRRCTQVFKSHPDLGSDRELINTITDHFSPFFFTGLNFASVELRADRDVVLRAVLKGSAAGEPSKAGNALGFASARLADDETGGAGRHDGTTPCGLLGLRPTANRSERAEGGRRGVREVVDTGSFGSACRRSGLPEPERSLNDVKDELADFRAELAEAAGKSK